MAQLAVEAAQRQLLTRAVVGVGAGEAASIRRPMVTQQTRPSRLTAQGGVQRPAHEVAMPAVRHRLRCSEPIASQEEQLLLLLLPLALVANMACPRRIAAAGAQSSMRARQ